MKVLCLMLLIHPAWFFQVVKPTFTLQKLPSKCEGLFEHRDINVGSSVAGKASSSSSPRAFSSVRLASTTNPNINSTTTEVLESFSQSASSGLSSSPTSSSSSSTTSTRWTGSSRWEAHGDIGEQFLLKEKYGTYFKVPNPATLFTKIICTIGPKSSDHTTIGRMMDAGMTAARINMSHGEHDVASKIIDTVRDVAKSRSRICPIILDTKGPEIRVTWIPSNGRGNESNNDHEDPKYGGGIKSLDLESGDAVILLTGKYSRSSTSKMNDNNIFDAKAVGLSYEYLAKAVVMGDVVLLDDGRISLIVTKVVNEDQVYAQVIEGGTLLHNKGVNLPGCHVELPHLTDKDKEDIRFGVSKGVEYIAHSFTRSATGINQVREIPGVVENGIHIIAKIENQEGVDSFASILRVSDGIMVARGDLGVEIPLERVCSVQKRLVASCNAVGKPVIVATELLDSMISSPRPTRAEASDVANAVFDGADCVMLSGETAIGKYPVETIQVMTRICKEAELDVTSSLRAMAADDSIRGGRSRGMTVPGLTKGETGALRDAFCKSAVMAARETDADLIMAISRTGLTANALAKYFSSVPVMVLSTSPQVCHQILLHRSVTPYLVDSLERASCVPRAISKATELGLVVPGSRVLLLTGKDDMIANRLETFVVGEQGNLPPLPAIVPSSESGRPGYDESLLQP